MTANEGNENLEQIEIEHNGTPAVVKLSCVDDVYVVKCYREDEDNTLLEEKHFSTLEKARIASAWLFFFGMIPMI